MTAAEFRSLGKGKQRPAKMEPMKDASLESRVKQLEKENAALWTEYGELLCRINKMEQDNAAN